jgi:predicted  nucleic acid-binding Zn-ribbon protein
MQKKINNFMEALKQEEDTDLDWDKAVKNAMKKAKVSQKSFFKNLREIKPKTDHQVTGKFFQDVFTIR